MIATAISRSEAEDLYFAYAAAIDDDLDRWPTFFATDAVYKLIARENYDRNLALCTVLAEGTGMMEDRITAIRQTMVFQPRDYRHLISNVRVLDSSAAGTRATAHFAVFESTALAGSRLLAVGRSFDLIERAAGGALRFKEKTCVYDGNVVQSSLVYPI